MAQLPFQQATERWAQTEAKVNDWARGGNQTAVDFGAGPVRSPARVIDEIEKRASTAIDGATIFKDRGGWSPGIAYQKRDLVLFGVQTYRAMVDHVSSATFSNDLAAGYWVVHQGITKQDLDSRLTQDFAARDAMRGQAAEMGNYLDVLVEPTVVPNAALRQVMATGVGKVLLGGHSIAEGADIPAANHFFTTLSSMFAKKFPGVAWTFHNRGLAGKTSTQLVSPGFVGGVADSGNTYFRAANANPEVWPSGSTIGRAYLDELRLLEPDVLIVYMWQNNNGNVAVSVADTMTLLQSVSAWAKVPQVVLCTEYLPASFPDDQYGADAATQNGIQAIADAIRAMAMKLGLFLIDFNAIYRLERDGAKVEHPMFFREASLFNFDGGADGEDWLSAGVSVSSGTATFGPGGGTLIRKVKARDVEQKGTFGYLTAGDIVKFSWGRTNPANENEGSVLQLRPNGASTALDLYARGTLITTMDAPFAHGNGGKLAYLVRIVGGRMVAHFRVNDGVWHAPVTMNFPETAASTGLYPGSFGVTVYSPTNAAGQILFEYEGNYTPADVKARIGAAMPEMFPQTELMGSVPFGDMATNPVSLGGNAINHVGSIGSHLYMIPAVARFVQHFARVWDIARAIASDAAPEVPVEFTSEMKLLNLSNGALTSFSPPQSFSMYSVKRGRMVNISGVYGAASTLVVPEGYALAFTLPHQAAFTDGTRLVVQSLYAAQADKLIPAAPGSGEVFGCLGIRIPGSTSYATINAMSVPTGTSARIATVSAGAFVAVGGSYVSA